MRLKELGFSKWFRDRQEEPGDKDYAIARVTAVNRDNYLVRNESGEALAELSGEYMFSAKSNTDFPVVGDWASVRYFNEDTLAIIYNLFPRRTLIRRKAAGKKVDYQPIASNIDAAFIIQSCDFNFNLRRMERYLVMVRDGNIEPVILLSKADLVGEEELERILAETRAAKISCKG